MIGVFTLMILWGGFAFVGFGFSAANSIEAHKNERLKNIFAFLCLLGAASFILGFIGVILIDLQLLKQ